MNGKLLVLLLVTGLVTLSGCINSFPAIQDPDELWENREAFLNRKISIQGTADYYRLVCTEMVCSGNPCCNSCNGEIGIRLSNEWVLAVMEVPGASPVKCEGNECLVECTPLEQGKDYVVTGTLKKRIIAAGDREEFYIELEAFSPIPLKQENDSILLEEIKGLGIKAEVELESKEVTMPVKFNDAEWGPKKLACENAGYRLQEFAGKRLWLNSYAINETHAGEPLQLNLLSTNKRIACAYKSVRAGSQTAPGIFAVNANEIE